MLIVCNLQGFTQTLFCCLDGWVGLSEQQFAFQSKQFRVPKQFSLRYGELQRVLNGGQAFVNAAPYGSE